MDVFSVLGFFLASSKGLWVLYWILKVKREDHCRGRLSLFLILSQVLIDSAFSKK